MVLAILLGVDSLFQDTDAAGAAEVLIMTIAQMLVSWHI